MPSRARWLRVRPLTAALLAFTAGASAHQLQEPQAVKATGFLLGQVLDAITNRPIAGATVILGGGTVTTTQLASGEVVMTNALPAGAPGSTPTAPRQIITDGSGRFLFREISRGTYNLRATSMGYVTGMFGQVRPAGASQSLVVERDDDRRTGLVVKLWRVATVSGRIVDEAGEPVPEVDVRLVRKTFVNGRPRLAAGQSVWTDDRGMYRFPNVTPGDYLVGVFSTATTLPASLVDAYQQAITAGTTQELVSESSMSGAPFPSGSGYHVGSFILQMAAGRGGSGRLPLPAPDGRIQMYPTVFYPQVATPAEARTITLAAGDDRSAIDLQLALRPSVTVSGTISGPDGPVKNIGVKLFSEGTEEYASLGGMDAAVTATDASGAFTFLGVTRGSYRLQIVRVPRAQPPRNAPMTSVEITGPSGLMMGIMTSGPAAAATLPLPADPTLWGGSAITVGDSDIRNLAIMLRSGARVSGKLIFEGAAAAPPADVVQRASIQIQLMTGATLSQVGLAQKRIEADGTFATVGYPPGMYSVSASIPPPPRGGATWRLKAATHGGRDLLDSGLEIQSSDITGLTLVFTDRASEVSGTVVDAKGQPDTGAVVIAIPADSMAWRQGFVSPRRVRSTKTTSAGGFTFADLPPGEYWLTAVSDAILDNWQDPAKLDAISRAGTRVAVAEGAKIAQRLTTATIK